jgi:hypothetical protein
VGKGTIWGTWRLLIPGTLALSAQPNTSASSLSQGLGGARCYVDCTACIRMRNRLLGSDLVTVNTFAVDRTMDVLM